MPWLKIIKALFIVSVWGKHALEDGKITVSEAFVLASRLATLLGLPTEFTGPDFYKFADELREDNLILKEEK